MPRLALCLACLLALVAACGPSRPELASRLSPEARSAAFPELVSLGPLMQRSDQLLPRAADREGQSLEARAADLRRRAAALRAMPL
ncbi:hypothetical protein HKCCSP123_07775 [Rhodobacterales bacterium HKCCSP123]|nr:hypothetical protein [Rhodobacterales bacterium HKCCSP123]